MKTIRITIILIFLSGILSAQTYTISGKVTDLNENPLTGANVWINGTSWGASTGLDGTYFIQLTKTGQYELNVAFIGYRSLTTTIIISDKNINTDFTLQEGTIAGEDVIVSALRRPQKIVDAPTTMTVVNTLELRRNTGYSFANALQHVKGLNIYRQSVDAIGLNARGFMTGYNYRFQLMTDGMSNMLTGNGLSAVHMTLAMQEDIDRIEIIFGPSSALYGPNAHNGLLNVITKHPEDSQGGTLVAGIGQNSLLNFRARYAGTLGKIAFKLNAERLTGKDFNDNRTYWMDLNRNNQQDGGEYTVEGNKTPIEHNRLGGAAFYKLTPRMELGGGYNYYLFSTRYVTNIGHNILNDWQMQRWFVQLTHPRFFARVHSIGNKSDQYYQEDIRALLQVAQGLPYDAAIDAINLIDKSKQLAVEIQANSNIAGINLIGGVSWDRENPVSERTVLLDRGFDKRTGQIEGDDIIVNQLGLYGQAETNLPADFAVTAAFRYDMHDNYKNQFSPRLGLVWSGTKSGNFRITWNRAFQAPAIAQQYLYIYIPGSRYQAGNGLGFTLADGSKIDPLEPETNQTLEFGYKGFLMKNLYIDVNYYSSHYQNFISGFIPVGRATKMGDTDLDPNVVLLTYLNFGDITINGFDLATQYQILPDVSIFANYSFVDQSNFDEEKEKGLQSADSTFYKSFYFNTPTGKWNIGMRANNLFFNGLDLGLNVRHVDKYDFVAGRWKATEAEAGTSSDGNNPYYYNPGPLGGFTLIDLLFTYKISNNISLLFNIENLFNAEAFQMIGSPSIRRLINGELKYTF